MEIEKIEINGYDVYIHKTKKYSSIHMRFLFENDYTRENIFKYDLLAEYMIHSAAKYKTREALNERRMELYALQYGVNNYNMGEKMFTEATFSFYDPELVGDEYMGVALEFAHDILFEPNFEGGKLDEDELARSKANLATNVEEELMDFKRRSNVSLLKTLFPGTYKMVDKVESRSEYEDIVNEFTDEDLIAAHKHLIEHSLVGLVIMGNVTDEHLSKIEELFKFAEVRKLDEDYKEVIAIDSAVGDFNHVVDEDYKESVVRAIYTYPTESRRDKLKYYTICRMMGGSGMLIHRTLRDEQGIVYSAGASYSKKLDYLVMTAFIDAKNVEVALEGFDRVLEKLEDRTLVEKLLNKVKEEAREDEYIFDESKWNVFYELYDTAFNFDISESEKNELIQSLTVDDIVEALAKMKRATVHFYEGAKK